MRAGTATPEVLTRPGRNGSDARSGAGCALVGSALIHLQLALDRQPDGDLVPAFVVYAVAAALVAALLVSRGDRRARLAGAGLLGSSLGAFVVTRVAGPFAGLPGGGWLAPSPQAFLALLCAVVGLALIGLTFLPAVGTGPDRPGAPGRRAALATSAVMLFGVVGWGPAPESVADGGTAFVAAVEEPADRSEGKSASAAGPAPRGPSMGVEPGEPADSGRASTSTSTPVATGSGVDEPVDGDRPRTATMTDPSTPNDDDDPTSPDDAATEAGSETADVDDDRAPPRPTGPGGSQPPTTTDTPDVTPGPGSPPATPPTTGTTRPPVVTPPATTPPTAPPVATPPPAPVTTQPPPTQPPATEPPPPVTSPPTTDPPAETVTVRITATGFSPAFVTISPGSTVVWVNQAGDAHDVRGGSFGSSTLAPGEQYAHRFDQSGVYAYGCGLHLLELGAVTVG